MRCRNCGELHLTQTCQVHGPWYPEEGKARDDYTDIIEMIDALVAADIIAEHDANHAGDDDE